MTPNWTTDRPTKPGEYWLAVHTKQRLRGMSGTLPIVIAGTKTIATPGEYGKFGPEWAGALWAKRKEPGDPWTKG